MLNQRSVGIALGVVVVGFAAATAYRVATAPGRVVAAPEPLVVNPARLDFGEVWEDRAFIWRLPIENRSQADVEVVEFEASCGCIAVEPRTVTIPGGSQVQLKLTLDLTTRIDDGKAVRDFELPIVPRRNEQPASPAVWVLRGRVRRAVGLESRFLQLGELTRGQPFPQRTVRATPRTPLKRLEVRCVPPLAVASVRKLPEKDGTLQIRIVPGKEAPAGPLHFDVEVQPVTTSGERLPKLAIRVEGVVREDVQASPAAVTFGILPLGQTVEEVVVIRSTAGKPFSVATAAATSGELKVERVANAPTGTQGFRVSQRVTRLGQQSAEVRFEVKAEAALGKPVTIVVPVSYYNKTGGPRMRRASTSCSPMARCVSSLSERPGRPWRPWLPRQAAK